MNKNLGQLKLLYEAVRLSGIDPIHIPYTAVFEKHFDQNATLEEKHIAYESLLAKKIEGEQAPATPNLPSSSPNVGRDAREIASVSPAVTRSFVTSTLESSLFDDAPALPLQNWRLPVPEKLASPAEERRARISAAVANSRLGKREYKIAYLLHYFPETRDSDTTLCIYYWRTFQAHILERWQPFALETLYELERIETIGRLRRVIQNTLGLYRGTARTIKSRDAIQAELHQYLASRVGVAAEIRFYFDETGNESGKVYRGIAGICVMNWRHFEIHYNAIDQWRKQHLSLMPIHFSGLNSNDEKGILELLKQLQVRRGGILFVGHAVHSRGRTSEDYSYMIVQLVLDSLRRADELACLNEPRTLRVIKEAEPGFDDQYLAKLNIQLQRSVELEFPGRVVVLPIQPMVKGKDVMLECADLIAGGMQRRALYGGRNPKDQLAEAIICTAGFEDANDVGAVFRYHVPLANR